jgi:tetratricopeptide (TPR) repeat protein
MKKNSTKSLNSRGTRGWLDFTIENLFFIIIFLTPIIFDRRVGIVFSGAKIAWLRALVVIFLGLWAIKLIICRKHPFIRTPLDWPILSFLLSTTVAALTSIHVYTSLVGFYGRFEGLSTWYIFGLLFFITTNYIHSGEQLKKIIILVISAATLMSIYGFIQRHELDPYMWGGVITWQRVIGTIGQPNFLAAYILMAFFLNMALFLEERKSPASVDWAQQAAMLGYFIFAQVTFLVMIYSLEAHNIVLWYLGFALISALVILFAGAYEKLHPVILDLFFGACLLMNYVCLLYTQSRGGYMGFFTGAVIFAFVAGRYPLLKSWKKLSIFILMMFVVSGITMSNPEFSPLARFSAEVSTTRDTKVEGEKTAESQMELKGAAGSRGETWKSAFKIIADYPLFGIGPEVLKMAFPRYETELFRFKETFHVKQDRCHNETFDVPVTKGMLSFFVYLWILFLVFKIGISKAKGVADNQKLLLAGMLAAALSYLIQNQFSFGVVAITSLFWIIWGMVMVIGEEKTKGEAQTDPWIAPEELPWLSVAGVMLAAVFLIYLSFLSFRGDLHYKSGKTYLELRNLPQAIEEFKRSLSIFPFEGNTVSHLGIACLNAGNPAEAIKYLHYGAQIDPYNADNFYMLARIHLALYDQGNKAALGETLRYIDISLKIDPYYAEVYDLLGQIYERQGKINEAEAMYARAFDINPTLADVMRRYINAGQKTGQTAKVKRDIASAYRKFPDSIELFKALGSF